MKQGRSVITIAMLVLAVAIAIYFGVYVFDTFNDPFSTTLAYVYTEYDAAQTQGVLVREERVLTTQTGIVEVVCGENKKVASGELVARVYRDSRAKADYAQLERLEDEIELLQSVIDSGTGVESAARLDEDILDAMVQLRASVSLNDYSQMRQQVQQVKGNVLRRGYLYGDGVTTADIRTRLKELRQEQTLQSQQFAGAAVNVRASASGVFSSYVDGYESSLTPQAVSQLTPAELSQLLNQTPAVPEGGYVGKLITSNRWYFACLLGEESAARLPAKDQSKTVTVRFTGDFSQDVEMRVESVQSAEDGQAMVIFSSDRYLARTTQLRQQTAQVIFDDFEGLRVPKQALRMEYDSDTDPETGMETQSRRLGVYVLVSGRAEFKEVEVVAEGSEYYVLRAAKTGSRAFRAGDEVIVRAVGLQDGQLLDF